MHRPALALMVFVLLGWLPAGALGDARLQFVDATGTPSEILIRGAYARMDVSTGPAERSGYLLFHADSRALYLVDETSRSYVAFNEAVVDAQIRTMTALIEDLRDLIRQLPEEERAQWDLQLGTALERTPITTEVISTDRRGRVGNIPCQHKEIRTGNRLRRIACVAPPESLGLSRRDFATLDDLQNHLFALSNRLLQAGGPMGHALSLQVTPRLGGVPLQISDFQDHVITRLVAISTDPIQAESFRIPPGFQEASPFHGQTGLPWGNPD